ncbi:MAG: hypothetical protein V3V08_23540 [Nannocystaceae bacterium]
MPSREYADFSRALWTVFPDPPGEEYRLDPDGGVQYTCPSPRCDTIETFAENDEPERCSCGAAYDPEQYQGEQAAAREEHEWLEMAERRGE